MIAAALEAGPAAPGFPASLETVIAVRASDTHGRVRGVLGGKRAPLLAAPGMQIVTTVPRGAYNFLDGSSLAAAHVTGIAALLLERAPRLAPRQVRAFLGANPQSLKPAGVVDACRALEKLVGGRACP